MKGDLDTEKVAITAVQPHPKNVRQGDIGAICESLEAHGQYRAIVAQRSTGHILAGNHTWKAAKQLGWSHITTHFIDCDDDGAMRILLADNRANDLASYDDAALIAVLQELSLTDDGLAGTLFDGDALDQLIGDIGSDIEQDEIPTSAPSITQLGDIWLLGKHRLMCGDSTNQDMMTNLMCDSIANMVFTDPPYGIRYQSNQRTQSAKFDHLKNDDVFLDFVLSVKRFSHGFIFIWTSWKVIDQWLLKLSDLGYPTNIIIWDKGGGGIGDLERTFSTDFEMALVWNRGNELTGKRIGSVWSIGKDSANEYLHPTQKPVALGVQAIQTTSKTGDIVLDLFGGSGSTLIAAHQTGRTCYTMELDPHYCDIICARYQKQTGDKPRLEATGDEHNFLP